MARTRRSGNSQEFKCPECGKTFARAASLGAHRRRAHGIAGASTRAKSGASRGRRNRAGTAIRAEATKTSTAAVTRRNRAGTPPVTASSQTRRARRPRSTDGHVDRDALLQTLFPNGLPAREEVIRSVNSWLDEAARLAALK